MKSGTGDYVQGYNCQAAVDAANQIIVAQAVTNQAPDAEHFSPMLDAVGTNVGKPAAMTADAGYWSQANAAHAEAAGVDAYISVARDKHGQALVHAVPEQIAAMQQGASVLASDRADQTPAASQVASATAGEPDPRARMREKVTSASGKAIYRLRKTLPEPVFGQIKQARGFRRFLLRGVEGARCKWSLITTTHNFLKLVGGLRRSGRTLKDLMRPESLQPNPV